MNSSDHSRRCLEKEGNEKRLAKEKSSSGGLQNLYLLKQARRLANQIYLLGISKLKSGSTTNRTRSSPFLHFTKPTHKSFSKIGCKTLVDMTETRGYAHPPKEAYRTILHFNGFRSSTLKGAHLLLDKQFGDYSLAKKLSEVCDGRELRKWSEVS
jgi:hypothetical protein